MNIPLIDIGLALIVFVILYSFLEYMKHKEKGKVVIFTSLFLGFMYNIFLKVPLLKTIKIVGSGIVLSVTLYILLNLKSADENSLKNRKDVIPLVLKTTEGKDLKYFNPTDNFLVYGGANAGKTASIGKPALLEYLKLGYSTFVYDAKEYDYAKTVNGFYSRNNVKSQLYYANFVDPNKSNRFNMIKPVLFKSSTQFEEVLEEFLISLQGKESNESIWFDASVGLFKGVSWIFYKKFPELCTLPHISNFILHRSIEDIVRFLNSDFKAKGYASAFLRVLDSEKTLASVMFNMSTLLSKIANNETICYILSGDDFTFDFTDPNNPISFCVCNSHQISKTLSPIIGALVNISAKQFTSSNTNKVVYCMDEATTFKVPNYEGLPSLLREFNVAFILLTQSASKIEKLYGKLDLNSIHSNFKNKFFGLTGDINAIKMYQQLFEKVENEYVSQSESFGERYSEGRTTSTRKEFKYDTDFFNHLKPGEFVGLTGDANVNSFHKRFIPYDKSFDREIKIIQKELITEQYLEEYHKELINEVKSITI